jgi:predicted amidophosphoribosyltransferase
MFNSKYFSFIFQTIYPSNCLSCDQDIADICPLCLLEIDCLTLNFCPTCGLFEIENDLKDLVNDSNSPICDRCLTRPLNHQKSQAILPYHHPISRHLLQAKYPKNSNFCNFYRLLDFCNFRLSSQPHFKEIQSKITMITCMPTQPKRLRQRGASIPYLFAQSLRQVEGWQKLQYQPKLLKLTRHQGQQVHLNGSERWTAQAGLFDINLRQVPKSPQDHFLLIVDDVSTTGSTFFHAVEACVRVGFRRDQIFTLSIFGGSLSKPS